MAHKKESERNLERYYQRTTKNRIVCAFQIWRSIGEQFAIEAYKETKNILTQKNETHKMGEIIVIPKSSKEPKITKVVLFNRGARDVNKASYTDRLIARAYCVGMFNKTINFHLWEDDAPKGGHNVEINKNNRHNKAYPARVNIDGIAEAVISLAADQKVLRQVANKMMMKGDKDEGQYHEFYVTASYDGKILNANQTNVDVVNPDYKKDQPKPKSTSTPTKPAPSPKKDESLVAKSINFVIDAVVGAFETPEKTKSPAMVKSVPEQKTPTTCVCKEQYKDLVWGGKVSCEFRKKVVQICAELWGESRKMEMASGLMAVMKVETWGSFKAHHREGYKNANDNPKDLTVSSFHKNGNTKSSRAVGLIQFTQDALEGMGEFPKSTPSTKGTQTRYDALNNLKLSYAQMGEIKQLDKVKKYFESAKNKIKSPEDIYLHVFAPKGVGQKDDFLLYQKGTTEYNNNKSVDKNNDGIQRKEILARFYESKKEGINNKPSNFTCGVDNKNNDDVKATDIITYHIYASGKIEKHIPKKIKSGFENKYKYVYHDKNNKEHDICIVDKVIAQNWIKGSKVDGGKGWEKRTAGKTRYYQKGDGKVELIKIKLPINYNKDGVLIKIGDNTDREYINPISFASMIGTVAECGYSDFNFNGSTSKDGTGAPSVTHVNGVAFDFRYLRKDKSGNNLYINEKPNDLDVTRQEKFIDALIKFGYSKFYSVNITLNGKKFILKNSTNMADHHHHLHIRKEGYNPNYRELKQ